jgi:methionine salvage enolase-phosphatase E1
MPGFPPIARAPGSPGSGTPAPVPDIQGDVEGALASLQLRGEHRFSIEGKSYVVFVSDHRDVPMVKAALAQVEQQDGIKVSVKVGQ